jgi:hypothetical protein
MYLSLEQGSMNIVVCPPLHSKAHVWQWTLVDLCWGCQLECLQVASLDDLVTGASFSREEPSGIFIIFYSLASKVMQHLCLYIHSVYQGFKRVHGMKNIAIAPLGENITYQIQ